MNILVSTALLSPYRVDWLNELGKYAEVEILYLEEGNIERNKEWLAKRPENCKYRIMRGKKLPVVGKVSLDVINEVKRNTYDVVICDGYGFFTQLINMRFFNKRKIEYYVNVDGAIPREHENAVISFFKKKIISAVPHFLCGSKATEEIIVNYGSSHDKIIHHAFSSLYKEDLFPSVISDAEKAVLRRKLGISEKQIIISVGRFSYMNGYGKGYDAILRAASRLKDHDIGWYIVGGKPTEEFQKMTVDMQLANVHFIDFKPKEELKEYYRASDLFVLMTVGDVWGLVINEAMACGLPIITTDKCVAGVELVKNGENGYIIPVGDDGALAKCASEILMTKGAVKTMGEASLRKIENYTIEEMAETHIKAFETILGKKI